MELIAELTDISKERLLQDETIGADGLLEIARRVAYGERHGKFYPGGGPRAAEDRPVRRGAENWLQRLIAACLRLGIGKRELLEDYYPGRAARDFTGMGRTARRRAGRGAGRGSHDILWNGRRED